MTQNTKRTPQFLPAAQIELLVADIGGTHARFAIAQISADTAPVLHDVQKLSVTDFANLPAAVLSYRERIHRDLPDRAVFAIAAPVRGEEVRFTNNDWRIRPADLPSQLGIKSIMLLNDLEASAHAAASLQGDTFIHIGGPEGSLEKAHSISVIGVGTGLGVAGILRDENGSHILATEGGHVGFAPVDPFEDALLGHLRREHGRVSAERVAAGMGLRPFMEVLAAEGGQTVPDQDDKTLWQFALSGSDPLAAAARDRYLLCLGSIAGDIALMHGPGPVVLTGGLGARLAPHLANSGFMQRFVAKGRYRDLMETLPVKLMQHDEPGLFGAASAFLRRGCGS